MNCGKKTSQKKICENCNAKIDSAHNFCKWCGTELEDSAKKCPGCKEKVKSESLIVKIIGYVIGALSVIVGVVSLTDGNFLPGVFFLMFGVLLFPIIKDFIRKITCSNSKLHNIVMKIRIIALVVFIIGAFATIPPSTPDSGSNESNGVSDNAKEAVIQTEQQALNAAKQYIKDYPKRVEQKIASECGFSKFYSPEFISYTTHSNLSSWTITVKGNMTGYVDEYGTDIEKYKFDMKFSVSEDGRVNIISVDIS